MHMLRELAVCCLYRVSRDKRIAQGGVLNTVIHDRHPTMIETRPRSLSRKEHFNEFESTHCGVGGGGGYTYVLLSYNNTRCCTLHVEQKVISYEVRSTLTLVVLGS